MFMQKLCSGKTRGLEFAGGVGQSVIRGATVRTQNTQKIRHATKGLALGCLLALAGGCADSTIHKRSSIADVETLSLDAKQRVVFAGQRQDYPGERILCTEPMPDALVARAAVLSASGNFSQTGGLGGGGGAAGGSSESAASLSFRNESIQMLRDGYFRLCEAYMNGALTKTQYQDMITNADTFMVVISALQTLGSNPVAPAVAINAGGLTASVPKDGGTVTASTTTNGETTKITAVTGTGPTTRDAKTRKWPHKSCVTIWHIDTGWGATLRVAKRRNRRESTRLTDRRGQPPTNSGFRSSCRRMPALRSPAIPRTARRSPYRYAGWSGSPASA